MSPLRGIELMVTAVERIAAVAFAFVTLLTFVSAVLRYGFNYPIPDAFDITRMMLGVMVFWGLASVAWRDTHIRVDLFWEMAGPRLRRAMDLVAGALTTAALCALAWYMAAKVVDIHRSGEVTFDLRILIWPFYLAIWIGALASALMAVLRIALLFSGRATEVSAPTTAD